MFLRCLVFIVSLWIMLPAYAYAQTEPAAADTTTANTPAAAVRPEDYIEPTWVDLLHSMVRFNAIDLHDNNMLDEYAAVTDCEIYKFYYKDDFKWNEIRKKLRASADMEMIQYPVHYSFYTVLKLGRYDFDKKIYRFTDQTAIRDVNVFTIYKSILPMCDGKNAYYIPKSFQAVADTTFTMLGLPLAPADAQALLRQMNAEKNTNHEITVKFNMTIVYIGRLHAITMGDENGGYQKYVQDVSNASPSGALRMDVHLDSVNFY